MAGVVDVVSAPAPSRFGFLGKAVPPAPKPKSDTGVEPPREKPRVVPPPPQPKSDQGGKGGKGGKGGNDGAQQGMSAAAKRRARAATYAARRDLLARYEDRVSKLY